MSQSVVVSRFRRLILDAERGVRISIGISQNESRVKIKAWLLHGEPLLRHPDELTLQTLRGIASVLPRRAVADRAHRHSSGVQVLEFDVTDTPPLRLDSHGHDPSGDNSGPPSDDSGDEHDHDDREADRRSNGSGGDEDGQSSEFMYRWKLLKINELAEQIIARRR